jgi:hypothetical protein
LLSDKSNIWIPCKPTALESPEIIFSSSTSLSKATSYESAFYALP